MYPFVSKIHLILFWKHKGNVSLPAIIAKYGCPVSQWPLLYQALMNKIALCKWLNSRESLIARNACRTRNRKSEIEIKILKLLRSDNFFIELLSLSCFWIKACWPEKKNLPLDMLRFVLSRSLSTVFVLVQVCHSAFMTARPAKMKAVLDPQRFYHFFRSLCSFSEVMPKEPSAFRNESTVRLCTTRKSCDFWRASFFYWVESGFWEQGQHLSL